jgi:hypothetical protein
MVRARFLFLRENSLFRLGICLIRQYTDATGGLWNAFGLPLPRAREEMLRVMTG